MSQRQYFAMTTAAMVAPLTVISAQISWLTALVCGFLTALYIIIRNSSKARPLGEAVAKLPRPVAWAVYGLYAVATGILTAYGAAMAVRAYPAEGVFRWLPLCLLALASWIGAKGQGAVARFGGVLACFLLPALALVLAFGMGAVEAKNLAPTLYIEEAWGALAVGLVPLAGIWFEKSGKQREKRWIFTPVVASVWISIVTMGALGASLAQSVTEPFYLMTKGISLFGVMERFEGLVAAVLLLSFGCLLAYLSAVGGRIWMDWMPGVAKKLSTLPNLTVAFVAIWWLQRLPDWLPVALIFLFWGLLPPILTAVMRRD